MRLQWLADAPVVYTAEFLQKSSLKAKQAATKLAKNQHLWDLAQQAMAEVNLHANQSAQCALRAGRRGVFQQVHSTRSHPQLPRSSNLRCQWLTNTVAVAGSPHIDKQVTEEPVCGSGFTTCSLWAYLMSACACRMWDLFMDFRWVILQMGRAGFASSAVRAL